MSSAGHFNRANVVALVLAGAAALAGWQQVRLLHSKQLDRQLSDELGSLHRQRVSIETDLESKRRLLEERRAQNSVDLARLSRAMQDLEQVGGSPLWAEPPSLLPDWNPASPYVWLSKASFPLLPIQVFDEQGQLSPEIAGLIELPPETLSQLNAHLIALLEELHKSETSRAERSDEHLAGISGAEGEKLTIKVPASNFDVGGLKQHFEVTLPEALGTGRGELVERTASDWLDSHLSQFGTEPRIISLARDPNGTFRIAVKEGFSWFSTGGLTSIDGYIPAHLRPLFATILDKPPAIPPKAP